MRETVVSRNRRAEAPWLLPVMAGFVGLCILGGIGKMAADVRSWQRDLHRERERWDVDS